MSTRKIAISLAIADMCNGKFVSTKRQLKNGSYAFQFKKAPNKTYIIYESGAVRCIGRGVRRNSAGYVSNYCTPILFTRLPGDCREIKRVTFDEGIQYLLKRFRID